MNSGEAQRTESGTEITIATNAVALTIAGSDPSGGAGLQADLKTFQQLGCYGMSVVTLLTVQNTEGVERVEVMPVELAAQQLAAVVGDIAPRAIKTGALGSADMISNMAAQLGDISVPLVVDPVLVSKHGDSLADDACIEAYRDELIPRATVFTPNRFEAEAILDRKCVSLQEYANAAAELQALGPEVVVLKAGEFEGERHHMVAFGGGEVLGMSTSHVDGKNSHGAGCVLSAIITGYLAIKMKEELDRELLDEAIRFAVSYTHNAVLYSPGLGSGVAPVETRIIPRI